MVLPDVRRQRIFVCTATSFRNSLGKRLKAAGIVYAAMMLQNVKSLLRFTSVRSRPQIPLLYKLLYNFNITPYYLTFNNYVTLNVFVLIIVTYILYRSYLNVLWITLYEEW